jgi:hypothetical protein
MGWVEADIGEEGGSEGRAPWSSISDVRVRPIEQGLSPGDLNSLKVQK